MLKALHAVSVKGRSGTQATEAAFRVKHSGKRTGESTRNEANRRSWAKLGPERQRERYRRGHLKRTFSLSLEEYQKMYSRQEGRCAICEASHDVLCVDHDHDTTRVRGLLCRKCNTGIGQLSDSVVLLSRAISYLKQPQPKLENKE